MLENNSLLIYLQGCFSISTESVAGMYDFQSLERDWNFAMMASFFRRSFKRPSAFDSGSTHRTISIQSLSIVVVTQDDHACPVLASHSPIAQNAFPFWTSIAMPFLLHPTHAAPFELSKHRLHFQSLFHNADVKNDPFVASSFCT